jgi:hypothetical protein
LDERRNRELLPLYGVSGKIFNDLRRHKARGCMINGRRKSTGVPARFMPGTPENRLRQMELGGGPGI